MNQNPEQKARDEIDKQLNECGWVVQNKKQINLSASLGVAIREYQTDTGPADYILFVNRKPVGVIEAKKEEEGHHLIVAEEQSSEYARAKLKHLDNEPLPFVYESTGALTRFTDYRDPKPRSRPLFTFHRPETFSRWIKNGSTLRKNLSRLPELPISGLRECQIKAINKLEKSFKEYHPRALIQMATGSGKTFTAITFIYRLLKYADARRVLFLVDTKNLGEQAEQEFMAYMPNDDNRKFVELYNVQRLKSAYIAGDSQVCISTIQRLYSILKGEELDETSEETNPAEFNWNKRESVPVVYSDKLPIEYFDFIVIDECHRSIYNLWKQVLEYFDSFLIGLTATPDKRTFGFFNQNIVSEYTHENAVVDGVNVGYNVFIIETEITKKGSLIKMGEFVDKREKLSRRKRWEQMDEDFTYSSGKLDDEVVNLNQIRTVIKTFKDNLPIIFPNREEVPKTLIFAKTDSHADDIIEIVRDEFGEGNAFCKKVTYKTEEDPKSVLAQFRNDYYPRIAVTVDMIATGTDVKPLECLVFMRDVKSRNYFEQMKGRGTRTISLNDLRKVTPSAKWTKDHFIIIDAVGVTKSIKTDSRPLDRKPGVPLKELLQAVAVGARDEDLFTTLASRLARLDRIMNEKEKKGFEELSGNISINQAAKSLLSAYDPDSIEDKARLTYNIPDDKEPGETELKGARESLIDAASSVFTGALNDYIENVRKVHEQIIDTINPDNVITADWEKSDKEKNELLIKDFVEYIETHKDEITALQIFYNQPYMRRELTFSMIRSLLDKIQLEKPALAPLRIWKAYEKLGSVKAGRDFQPMNELTALVSLIRHISGIDSKLTAFEGTVDKNFKDWIFKKHSGAGIKFNEEQMAWLRMIKEHVSSSFHIDREDFELDPFNKSGGLGRFWQLFGDKAETILEELNEALAV